MTNDPIFIGGCGSSGTTLLRKILNAHSRIAIGEEMSVFDRPAMYSLPFDDLKKAIRSGDFTKFERGQVFNIRFSDGRTYCGLASHGNGPKHYHNHKFVVETLGMFDTTRQFMTNYFEVYAQKSGKARWGEKTPNNIFCVRDIWKMFPGSKFIHVLRDPRDVCLSLIQRRNFHPYVAVYRWIASINAAMSVDIHGSKDYFEVRYEDLVTDPENVVRAVCRFIGEEFEEGMLTDYFEQGREFDDTGMDYAESEITTRQVGKWKTADLGLVGIIQAGTWPYIAGLGYELSNEAGGLGREIFMKAQKEKRN